MEERLDGHVCHESFCFFKKSVIFFCLRYKLYLYHLQKGGTTVPNNNKPNPDDRSDNAEKLQSMIQDTTENIERAEDSLQFTESETQRQQIEAKNERRRESIDSFQSELEDESQNT
jgi:small acid-soluble spore protein (thioredoxin-like protein)